MNAGRRQSSSRRTPAANISSDDSPNPLNSCLVSTRAGQLFGSKDGGLEWEQIGTIHDGWAADLSFSGGLIWALIKSALASSADGGRSWQRRFVPGDGMPLSYLVESDSLIAGLGPSAIMASEGAAAGWRPVVDWSALEAQDMEGEYVRFLAPGGWAGIEEGGLIRFGGDGQFEVLFRGDVHASVEVGQAGTPFLLAAGHEEGVILLSEDRGRSWSAVASCAPLSALCASDAIFAGTSEGVLTSRDGGRSWARVLGCPGVQALAARGDVVLAGGSGLFRSGDGGTTWGQVEGVAGEVTPGGIVFG